ncbi:hypothetical protein [Nocardioides sp. SYSU D00038]|uniref:hypothetical protein n=1 Tax=Nocardioides sp. SYSU D00038 TaxID=2812554 RepID=UPI001966E31B|nr:hypothetical protein [Nocardioides sp. SYSU D00038]
MRAALLVAALALVAAGCGDDDTGRDGGPDAGPATSLERPTAIPAADGPVTTGLVTVLDDGGGAELCLGPVALSHPPQCSGTPLVGWDWAEHPEGVETAGRTRWAEFAVTGTFDGTALTPTEVVPAALHDPPAPSATPSTPSTPSPPCAASGQADCDPTPAELDDERVAQLQQEASDVPGFLGSMVVGGVVTVDVVHDDGTLQAWADQEWGEGTVVVVSALRPVAG